MADNGPASGSRPARLLDPTLLILLAALAVHVVRRNVFDIIVFAGTIILILIDRQLRPGTGASVPGRRSSGRRPPGRWSPARIRWWTVATLALLFGAVVGSLQPAGVPERIALAVPGLVAALLVTLRGRADRPRPIGRWWAAWPALLILAALIELSSFLQQPDPQTGSYRHPTLSTLIEPLLDAPVVRAGALMVWLAAGWWLVRAVVRPGDDSGTDGAVPPGSGSGPGPGPGPGPGESR